MELPLVYFLRPHGKKCLENLPSFLSRHRNLNSSISPTLLIDFNILSYQTNCQQQLIMDEEDWGTVSTNRPTFTLFRKVTPDEEARKNTFVDIIVYNRWSKAERRQYQRLKAEAIARLVEEEKIQSIDDISESLNQLNLFKSNSGNDECDTKIDDLISTLENMKLRAGDVKSVKIMEPNA